MNHVIVSGSEFEVNLRDLIDRSEKKASVSQDLDTNGHIRLYLQVSRPATGEQVAIAPVDIGEPAPKNLSTALQVSTRSSVGARPCVEQSGSFFNTVR